MASEKRVLEVCAGSLISCLAAQLGGADRVELCANLNEGGTTPSYGALAVARDRLHIDLNVMIRPRGGDFLYDEIELEEMRRDIDICKRVGANGIVLGVLTEDGGVDVAQMREFVALAAPLPVTFHRAFDLTRDPLQALEQVIASGCRRLLSSGQAASAYLGGELLRDLHIAAAGRLAVMPGSGVRADNIGALLRLTGCREFHASARLPVASAMLYRREDLSMGAVGADEYAREETSSAQVAAILQAMRDA
ncbi:MAG: copper homeostasis protein CutC [Paludibacterium sp.]|uniref:copper homeostasis protein CutC n=1 Tax=Paludibacterium sp. TaxID=1917523 RepID=UPI0025E75613|nr:copper homeostasis protein CutC [Paludibacterium sp.]MBV8047241.1 copper homeostasis protein CutC [Paludibacterium sp.]MBV8647914.1 copper homeostasis protein CutC [Paludibacterium sp.]